VLKYFGMNKYYAIMKGYSIYLNRCFIGWLEHKHTRYCNGINKCIELILRFDHVTCHLLDFSYIHSMLAYISTNDFTFLLFLSNVSVVAFSISLSASWFCFS